MAKKPTKKPAAKRGGKKKGAPSAKTPRRQVERHGKARAAEREFGRKPNARAQESALPHYDPADVAFTPRDNVAEAFRDFATTGRGAVLHPTVEEQFRADAERQASRAAAQEWPEHIEEAPRRWTRFRSAVTGLFVSMGFAKRNPGTTVGEKVES